MKRILSLFFVAILMLQIFGTLRLGTGAPSTSLVQKQVSIMAGDTFSAANSPTTAPNRNKENTNPEIASSNTAEMNCSYDNLHANNADAANYIGPAGIETSLEPQAELDGKAQETLAQPCGTVIQQSSNSTSVPVATKSCKAGASIDSHQGSPMSGTSDSPIFSYDLQEPTGVTPTGTSTALVNAASTGSLTIYVKNVNGNYVVGVRVVLYDVNYNTVGQQYTNSYGYVYWASLNYGTYFDEAYYPSPASLHLEEFWGGDQINVAASSTTSYFTRHTQYVYQIKANGQVIPGTDVEVNPGDNMHIDVTVANKESVAKNVEVTLYLDRDKSSPYDMPPTLHGPVTIPANSNGGGFGWDYSTNNYGSYWAYVVVYGYYNGKYIVTDQYDWLVAFYVRYPDLTWTRIWTNPGSPTGGQSATIYCELKNQGTGNTPITFTNYFYIDGAYDSYGVNNGLAAGAAFDWTFTRTLGPGYHTITASADVNNNVPEANEGNNQLSQKLWWSAPDLVVTSIWWVDAYGNKNPTITAGQNFTVWFTIQNNGDAAANGQISTYLAISNGQWGKYGPQSGLSVGGSVTYYYPDVMVSSGSSVTVTVTVDNLNAIPEANQNTGSGIGTGETNNVATASIPIQQASWTVINYMSCGSGGGIDLSTFVTANINAMQSVGSSPQVSIVCLADTSGSHDTHAYFLEYNVALPTSEITLKNIQPSWQDELDMGDTNTLITFATYAINRFRASHYILILNDHGGDLAGAIWDDNNPSGPDHMSISGIGNALTTITQNTGISKFAIMGLDACLMDMTEMAYQIRSSASIFVGSEKTEPAAGWNYADFLSYLKSTPSSGGSALATRIVDGYVNYYQGVNVQSVTLAAIDLSQLDNLADKINSLANVLMQYCHADHYQYQQARAGTEQYDDHWIVDLYHFTECIYAGVSDALIKQAAQNVQSVLTAAIIHERHFTGPSGVLVNHAHGLSIWFPTTTSDYNNYISQYQNSLSFGAEHWDEFLYDFIVNPNTPPLVQIVSPNSNSMWSKTQTITWASLDADYDSVTYTISFSADGGNTWRSLVTVTYQETPAWATHTATFDTTTSPDSKNCLISILFDDGRYQATVGSGTFTIDNTAPTTGIVHFAGSVGISLIANDATSGVYASYYRIDGGAWNLYTSAFTLSPGTTHLVESYSTDNAGNTGPTVHLTVYYLIMSTNYGSVSPYNGWYDSGTSVQISSTASGYIWNGWSGSGSGSYTGTANPATITFAEPISETASWSTPPPPGSLSGTITDSQTNAAISGATVSFSGPTSGSTTTDINGYYTVSNLVPVTYSITVSMTNYNSQTQTATVSSGTSTTVNFQLQPLPGSITGRVTDSTNGNGISGATVSYSGPSSGSISTDSGGYYSIPNLPEGAYQLTAQEPSYQTSSPISASVSPAASTTVNFQMQPQYGSITGRVTDTSNGDGVSGATVSYVGPISGSVAADSNGYYTIQNAPEGSYQLTASMFGYTTSSPSSTFVPPAGSVTVDFQLQRAPPFVVPVTPLGTLAATISMISILGVYVKLRKKKTIA